MASPSAGATAPGQTPPLVWLHTTGMRIADPQGKYVFLRGFNLGGMEYGNGGSYPQHKPGYSAPNPQACANVRRWGFNVARLPISWANIEPQKPTYQGRKIIHHWNRPYLETLDQVIANCARNHVYVILSMHQWNWSSVYITNLRGKGGKRHLQRGLGMPLWSIGYGGTVAATETITQTKLDFFANKGALIDDFADAWVHVARRYKNNPAVAGFDLLNEPDQGTNFAASQMNLTRFYTTVGQRIRTVNRRAMLFFELTGSTDGVTPTALPALENKVVSFHDYGRALSDEMANFTQAQAMATSWNIPIWLGEFSEFGNWRHNLPVFLARLRSVGTGWTYWAYDRSPNPVYFDRAKRPNTALLRVLQRGL